MHLVSAALLVTWSVQQAQAAPRMPRDNVNNQACGDRLAELLSLVCSGRGYNVAFRPEQTTGRRFRRGIVEECCHRSCSFALLELYCRAAPTEAPPNLQIRKRSDTEGLSMEGQRADETSPAYDSLEINGNQIPLGNAIRAGEGKGNGKIINLLNPFRKHAKNNIGRFSTDEPTEDGYRSQSLPAPRHRKKHHHGSGMLSRARGWMNPAKIERDKQTVSEEKESMRSFQIGTVKPYFVRSSVPHRSNFDSTTSFHDRVTSTPQQPITADEPKASAVKFGNTASISNANLD